MKKLSLVLLFLLALSPLAGKDTSPVPRFQLEYTSRGSMWPVFIQFTIDRNGYCVYSSTNRRTGAVERFTTRLSSPELASLQSRLLNDFNFFSLPDYDYRQHNMHQLKDGSTTYLTVSYSGKTRRIGGYAVSHVKTYSPVFSHVSTLIHILRAHNKGR